MEEIYISRLYFLYVNLNVIGLLTGGYHLEDARRELRADVVGGGTGQRAVVEVRHRRVPVQRGKTTCYKKYIHSYNIF